MAIQSDTNGFLIGERRLRDIQNGVVQTRDNTKEILDYLRDTLNEIRRERSASSSPNSSIDRLDRSGRSSTSSQSNDESTRRSVDAGTNAVEASERAVDIVRDLQRNRRAGNGRGAGTGNGGASSANDRARESSARDRERDSNGRFTSDGNSSSKLFDGLKVGVPDASGVDPTIDAIKEVKDFLSPMSGVFKGMSGRAISLFKGRSRRRRSDEVLPQEQVDANEEQDRSSRQRNKLLQRLINAVLSSGGGGAGGGLGGIFGRLFRGGGLKGLLRKVPLLGALLGGGALAMNWGGSSSGDKGKGIGEIVGTVVGGALGSFLGIGGTIAGGTLGSYLGGIFGEKVGKWTDSLKGADLPTIFKEVLSKAFDIGKDILPAQFKPFTWAGSKISGMFGGGSSGSSGGDGGSFDTSFTGSGNSSGQKAMSYFMSKGWTKEQSAGIVANFQHESNFNAGAVGDSGRAFGIGQWHPDRQAEFSKVFGKDIRKSTYEEQLAFVQYELTKGKEQGAGGRLKSATSAGQAGGIISKYYERPRDTQGEMAKRGATANAIARNYSDSGQSASLPNAKGVPYKAEIINSGMKKQSVPMVVQPVKAEMSKISSGNSTKSSGAPSDSLISQNVSDRGLAHVFSGSIGYDKYSA